MGRFFSDVVEDAIHSIYYDVREGKGAEHFAKLEQASLDGDGDASCILARCLCGPQYVWSGHRFPEDDRRATQLLHKSVEQGSAIGVLVSMRAGELTPSVEKKMPFPSLQAAFDEVLQKARWGDAFCQFTVGNAYFWWDFIRIEGKGKEAFSSQEEFKAYLKKNISQCEDWFWQALRGGMYFAANNLNHYYTKGDEDIIEPQPHKAKGVFEIGARAGYPLHQSFYADELSRAGKQEEALQWYKQAAQGGQLDSWYHVGIAYEEGKIVPKDLAYAAQCYEKGVQWHQNSGGKIGCSNHLGSMYFDGCGVEKDYAKAFQLLKYAQDQGNDWGRCYLGICYFRGWGTPQDYVKARELLERVDWANREAFYMLGVIYGQGLGVPEDIKKAVEYLQKAGDYKGAKEELLKYKRTLFGKWVRR